MSKLDRHPTVLRHRERAASRASDAGALWRRPGCRQLCLDARADDVGFVAIDRPELDDQRAEILAAFPGTRAL
ncbi:MAG: hypothetical protein U0800_02940 [Isosphaeraceae bacterium]